MQSLNSLAADTRDYPTGLLILSCPKDWECETWALDKSTRLLAYWTKEARVGGFGGMRTVLTVHQWEAQIEKTDELIQKERVGNIYIRRSSLCYF